MTRLRLNRSFLRPGQMGRPQRRIFAWKRPMWRILQGGVLLRVLYLSLDPYMRGRMDDRKSYAKPIGIRRSDVR